jgi:hypothetical protein
MTKDADHFDAHHDDADEWGAAYRAPARQDRPGSMISIRLSAEDARALREAAALRGETLSQFVRDAALGSVAASASSAMFLFDVPRTAVAAFGESIRVAGTRTAGTFFQDAFTSSALGAA